MSILQHVRQAHQDFIHGVEHTTFEFWSKPLGFPPKPSGRTWEVGRAGIFWARVRLRVLAYGLWLLGAF
jgi:hypothetical protein